MIGFIEEAVRSARSLRGITRASYLNTIRIAFEYARRQRRRRAFWKRLQQMDETGLNAALLDYVNQNPHPIVDQQLRSPKATIWVTAHFGDFIAGIAILGFRYRAVGRTLWVLLSDTHSQVADFFGPGARLAGVEFIASSIPKTLRHLRRGDGVVVLVDAVYPLPHMRFVPFFNSMIAMLSIAPRLAEMSDGKIIPFYCLEIGNRRRLYIDRAIAWNSTFRGKSERLYICLTFISQWLEQKIAAHPAEWHHWDRADRQMMKNINRPELLQTYLKWLSNEAKEGAFDAITPLEQAQIHHGRRSLASFHASRGQPHDI